MNLDDIGDGVFMHDWSNDELGRYVHMTGRGNLSESQRLLRDKAIQLLEERGQTLVVDTPGATMSHQR